MQGQGTSNNLNSLEKGRPQHAGAKFGQDRAETARTPSAWVMEMGIQLGKSHTSLVRRGDGTLPRTTAQKSSSQTANNTSELPPLTTSELIKETQCIILQFPLAQVAEEQGNCPRAIEAQRNGESSVSFLKAINWCRRNPRVRAQIMRLMGCDAETDPDFVQGLSLLINAYVRNDGNEDEASEESTSTDVDLFGGAQ